ESKEYIESIQKISPSAKFYFEPSRAEIEKLYAESEIFWHAKGINEENPLYFEHFGITTVEAMSAGCVPIVINKGGQKEIVDDSCGFKWNTLEELISITENLVKNHDKISELSKNAVLRAEIYTKQAFGKTFKRILKDKLGIDVE
ncbi:glycosyltransferase, partial [uncultured Treponema sp.]|uniref:glycosyltransferase n=1 Tax=uncultured Treponema sp. TaxID=162155 RepID=UPI0025D6F4CE